MWVKEADVVRFQTSYHHDKIAQVKDRPQKKARALCKRDSVRAGKAEPLARVHLASLLKRTYDFDWASHPSQLPLFVIYHATSTSSKCQHEA